MTRAFFVAKNEQTRARLPEGMLGKRFVARWPGLVAAPRGSSSFLLPAGVRAFWRRGPDRITSVPESETIGGPIGRWIATIIDTIQADGIEQESTIGSGAVMEAFPLIGS
jgi:hypothetical protein